MEILSFDIEGKFAHFRKFHGNNTALSYAIPPRTTIMGILAAICGEEKDSYYEDFNSENLKVGIRVMSNLKKSFHRLNLLMIKSQDDFRGQKGRVQTPFEIVTGENISSDKVIYRIYLNPAGNQKVFERIKKNLLNTQPTFNLSLGIANFSASVSKVTYYKEINQIKAKNEWVELDSAGNSDQIEEIEFDENISFKLNHIEEELMPADFVENFNRELLQMNRVLFATQPFPLRVKLTGDYFKVTSESKETETIQFLEYAGLLSQQS